MFFFLHLELLCCLHKQTHTTRNDHNIIVIVIIIVMIIVANASAVTAAAADADAFAQKCCRCCAMCDVQVFRSLFIVRAVYNFSNAKCSAH